MSNPQNKQSLTNSHHNQPTPLPNNLKHNKPNHKSKTLEAATNLQASKNNSKAIESTYLSTGSAYIL